MHNVLPLPNEDSLSLPPQNIEAEEAVLGGLLIDQGAIARVTPVIRSPKAFYIRAHQIIYETILALSKSENGIVDLMTVASALKDAPSREYENKLHEIGGQIRLVNLIDSVISAVNIDQYALLVHEKWVRREMIRAARLIEQQARRGDLSIDAVVNGAETATQKVSQLIRTGAVMPLSEVMAETFSDIEARSEGLVPTGIASGFYDLDSMTQGFQPADLITAAGRPSMGKTAIVLCIAAKVAADDLPVFVVSLEMSKQQLAYRILSRLTKIEGGRLRTGRIAQMEWEPLGHGVSKTSAWPLYIDDSATPTVAEVSSKASEIKARHGKLGLIVIDYLQLMEGAGDRQEFLARTLRGLKRMAVQLDVPVILLSQLSRAVESRTNKRPMLSDLRETGCIEQDSDVVLMLYRDEYYHPDTPDRGVTELIVAKHRNGPTGTVKLLFDASYGDFLNRSSLQ